MKKLNFKYLALVVVIISTHFLSHAQSSFNANESESKLVITGTSSVHDWETHVTKFTCDASLLVNDNQETIISEINFLCNAENIESDNRIMNNKTFDALKGDDFPEIKFMSSGNVTVTALNTDAQIKGKLTIAGKTKDVILPFKLISNNQQQVNVEGKTNLKMSDFGIDPPTAMLGTLKTGDEIVITYNIILQKVQQAN